MAIVDLLHDDQKGLIHTSYRFCSMKQTTNISAEMPEHTDLSQTLRGMLISSERVFFKIKEPLQAYVFFIFFFTIQFFK